MRQRPRAMRVRRAGPGGKLDLLGGLVLGDAGGELGDGSARARELEAHLHAFGLDGQHPAVAHRFEHRVGGLQRDEDAVRIDHFGERRDRVARIHQEQHGMGRAHLELAPLVGQHEPPVEILADDEAEHHPVHRLRRHGAVAEIAVLVVIGLALPHAGDERGRLRQGRDSGYQEKWRQEQGSDRHGMPKRPPDRH